MPDKPVFTSDQIVAQLTRLGVWNAPEAPIAYAFLEQRPSYLAFETTFAPFSDYQRSGAERAFGLVAEVANISFARVADNGLEPSPTNQRLTFYQIGVNAQYSGSTSPYQYDTSPEIYGADIHLNTIGLEKRAESEGFFDWTSYVTLHEILHAIGLSHPGDYNGAGYNYEDHAQFQQDTRQYSVMSYWDAAKTGADHFIGGDQFVGSTPLLYDILALQRMYGANTATRTGNTIYGFNSNTGASPFNFAGNPGPVLAIWDAGGIDTLDFSGWSGGSLIDLNDGAFSSGGGLTSNVAIAFGAAIEQAVGGAGNDILIGNALANRLDGGGGADQMTGGDGDDLFLVDNVGDLAIERSGDSGVDRVWTRVSFTLGDRIENLTLAGSLAIDGTGNGLANSLVGNAAANVLNGGAGIDTMTGGAGNDVYHVDSAGDQVIETRVTHGSDRVVSTVGWTLGSHVEHLTLAGTAAINGNGNSLANSLAGNSAANVLKGAAGNDKISGGAGSDKIYGGSGKDTLQGHSGLDGFYFDAALSASANVDRILDFSRADDTIFLDRDIFKGIAANGTLSAAAFRVGTSAADSSDRIVYDKPSGQIYYDADGRGGAAAVLFAAVTPDRYLTNADFVAFI
ncbi:MAG TPA: M10 family metallopeptidase C-terminal domain-containing protein [Allosphingosinicella sp.]|nr:M10 family metallopeptidase C-terminal domain-containing protein [Allosphingosinicella sp.]